MFLLLYYVFSYNIATHFGMSKCRPEGKSKLRKIIMKRHKSYNVPRTIKLKLIVLINFLLCLTSWLFCLHSWVLIRMLLKLYWRVILMLLHGFRNTRGAVKRSLRQIMR